MEDIKKLNVFEFIDYIFEEYTKIQPQLLEQRKYMDKDFVNEYIHLLSKVIYNLNNLYAHSPEEPQLETLKEDFESCLDSTSRLSNFIYFICNGLKDKEIDFEYSKIFYKVSFYYYENIQDYEIEELEDRLNI